MKSPTVSIRISAPVADRLQAATQSLRVVSLSKATETAICLFCDLAEAPAAQRKVPALFAALDLLNGEAKSKALAERKG